MTALKLALLLTLQFSAVAWADLSNEPANCTVSGWDWASNSHGDNACVVAGQLEAPCRGLSTYSLPHLNGTDVYLPPSGTDHPECECNTVIYALFQACTLCQNHNVTTWQKWEASCPSVYVTQYPGIIPAGTSVPHWAYLNWTAGFDPVQAQAAGDSPESTATAISTASVPGTMTSSGLPGFSTPSTTTTPSPASGSSSKSSSNTGAIAGGVVGGVVGLGLIAGLITWLVIRQGRGAPVTDRPISQYTAVTTNGPPMVLPYPPSNYSDPQMKFYSPNDPSTFPTADNVPSVYTSQSGTVASNQPGRYTGIPEL